MYSTVDSIIQRGCEIEFTIGGEFIPGEDMVRYYKDGSGYPGSPDGFDIVDVYATKVRGDNYTHKRSDREDWFIALDKVLRELVYEDYDAWEQYCLEKLDGCFD